MQLKVFPIINFALYSKWTCPSQFLATLKKNADFLIFFAHTRSIMTDNMPWILCHHSWRFSGEGKWRPVPGINPSLHTCKASVLLLGYILLKCLTILIPFMLWNSAGIPWSKVYFCFTSSADLPEFLELSSLVLDNYFLL